MIFQCVQNRHTILCGSIFHQKCSWRGFTPRPWYQCRCRCHCTRVRKRQYLFTWREMQHNDIYRAYAVLCPDSWDRFSVWKLIIGIWFINCLRRELFYSDKYGYRIGFAVALRSYSGKIIVKWLPEDETQRDIRRCGVPVPKNGSTSIMHLFNEWLRRRGVYLHDVHRLAIAQNRCGQFYMTPIWISKWLIHLHSSLLRNNVRYWHTKYKFQSPQAEICMTNCSRLRKSCRTNIYRNKYTKKKDFSI